MINFIVSLMSNHAQKRPVIVGAVIILAFSSIALADDYYITDLGTLGGNWSRASRLNELGQVVGISIDQTSMQHAFFWDGFLLHDLGIPDEYLVSGAMAVNDWGQIAGYANNDYQGQDAYIWQDDNWISLELEIMQYNSMATDINNLGHLVGYSFIQGQNGRSFTWFWKDSSTTTLGDLGGTKSYASAMNSSEQIVGWSQIANPEEFTRHAFLWEGGVISDLGVLPGETSSMAADINDSSRICGESSHKEGYLTVSYPCLWDDDEITDLGLLSGYSRGSATAINNKGKIVGWLSISLSGSADLAFIYEDGVMTDLNTLLPEGSGWDLKTASDINNNGHITGSGIAPNGETHAFLMTLVQTGIDEQQAALPDDYILISNYPNPFNDRTVISYMLIEDADVTLEIYDLLGRKVETLVAEYQTAGDYQVVWDAFDKSTGVYFYKMRTDKNIDTGMMTLLK